MAAAIVSLRAHLALNRRPIEILVDGAIFASFLIGLAYLAAKTYLLAGVAGYDFKYIWVAGEALMRGINPYVEDYPALAQTLVAEGHVPDMWVYPPNWYLPAIVTALPDLKSAALLWNLANIVLILASSALLCAALPLSKHAETPRQSFPALLIDRLSLPWNAFFLHVFALAALQGTAITLSVGQTSILIYFGVCLLLYGTVRNSQVAAVLGLTIVLLKPQFAAAFVAAMVFNRSQWGVLVKAALVSAAISLPSFVIAPTAAFDWLANLPHYDRFASADWPHSITGIRHIIWSVSGIDIGSMAGLALATVIMLAAFGLLSRTAFRAEEDNSEQARSVALILLGSAVTVALAPLHVYDLTLVGVPLIVLARARAWEALVGLCGAALLWRAGDLAQLTGFYPEGTAHFEGTRLATLGALLMLFAVFETLRQRRIRLPDHD